MYTPRGTKLVEDQIVDLELAGFPVERRILGNQEDEEDGWNG